MEIARSTDFPKEAKQKKNSMITNKTAKTSQVGLEEHTSINIKSYRIHTRSLPTNNMRRLLNYVRGVSTYTVLYATTWLDILSQFLFDNSFLVT
ncbi:transmembrane protein, putative [Medicago truncatula]|uniref:Transmembrane protein, putative n=1 Tax=Medicago truncatula TaxID=3880 RepID=A0A072U8M1_MEDTR|nr:transmembrane protein, putative [Medicago truncatula]